eukprot:2253541-Rhodomonas_salina.2
MVMEMVMVIGDGDGGDGGGGGGGGGGDDGDDVCEAQTATWSSVRGTCERPTASSTTLSPATCPSSQPPRSSNNSRSQPFSPPTRSLVRCRIADAVCIFAVSG